MANNHGSLIHWISREEVYAQQDSAAVRESRPYYPDPTADEAIGRIIREEKREKRKQLREERTQCRKPSRHPRIGVWRWDDDKKGGAAR